MQFKHPEILYFLFLLVIPILVHLFQLRRFKKEYFTNVHFLKELAIQTRKSSRLKKWLLLLTRLFLLACLIIAFAQPFFQAKDSKGITNEMFIVLDNSFSMQAKGKQGELMKRAVQELLENVPENQTFSLITNSETFWNTDIKSIQRELQNLKYSASPFVLDNLMAKIKSRKSPYNKDIVIITDAVGLQPKQLKNIDSTSNAYFIIPKAEQKNNVAIDSVFIQQALDNFYEIGIKLSSYGDNEKDIPISLYNNKKLVAKTIVNFEGKEKSINFTIPKGDFNGYAAIDDNALQYDNQLFFSISKPQKMNIVSIGQPEKSSFLKKIYSDNEFIFSNFDLKTLDYNILEKQDAIILNEVPEVPQALQTTLKTFVEKGGNLIVIPSSESSISNLNSLMGNFGKIQFKSLENGEKLVTKIAFNHPLYSTVFEKKTDNFQYPNVSSAYSISSTYPSILSFEDQNAFLTAIQNPVSSVYVFSAPLNKNNSNFQNSPLIVPTFYNMALSSQKTGISALTIGENSPFLIDASLSKDEIVEIKSLSEETNEKFIPMQQILNNKVKLTFNDFPQEAGNFGVYKQDNLLKEISFNYARTESNIATSNESVLSDYNVIGSIDEVFDTLQTNRTDNEIWKWFVFLTLLFLVTEILIQKFVK
ncbi:MAG: BatA and WFA domain-containing protein [Flavobacterium lindanitolerans]|uniref:vWA domain-containing protein n=1 Tax=Flavobacterium lindanitolerans TaxID=428988 RepID=UPI001A5E52DC|nr:BatA and WFA domain-containing protein [Flavobacterium lindanitolerans]MBL7869071.1 BatA and WFA domain-containing protein [Flavobacterium lindanitolerans]